MKQHITIDQLNELSEEAKQRLRKWWKPEKYDFFAVEPFDDIIDFPLIVVEITDDGRLFEQYSQINDTEPWKDALPLLSIGQMIEFLEEKSELNSDEYGELKFNVRLFDESGDPVKIEDRLFDTLWEAVKQVLSHS